MSKHCRPRPDCSRPKELSDLGLHCSPFHLHLLDDRSVLVAERLALPVSDHGVVGSNPAADEILPEPKRRFIAQSLSCSPSHRLEITEILLKGRKTLTHPSIFWMTYSMVNPPCSNFRVIIANFSDVPIFKSCTFSGTHTPTKCPAGTFSNQTGLANSSQCTPCTAGYYCNINGLRDVQGPCSPGYYCPEGNNFTSIN